MTNPGPLSTGVADAVKTASEHMTAAGAVLDEIEITDFEGCVDLDFDIIDAEAALYHRPWYERRLLRIHRRGRSTSRHRILQWRR